jgi:hypothetical protein
LISVASLKVYIAAATIGAIIGFAVGFSVFQLSGGQYNVVGYLIEFHRGRDALFWIIGGLLVAAAITFLTAPNAE